MPAISFSNGKPDKPERSTRGRSEVAATSETWLCSGSKADKCPILPTTSHLHFHSTPSGRTVPFTREHRPARKIEGEPARRRGSRRPRRFLEETDGEPQSHDTSLAGLRRTFARRESSAPTPV